jgi:FKBP-type peptidyl-prolyl cis-trans isomerase
MKNKTWIVALVLLVIAVGVGIYAYKSQPIKVASSPVPTLSDSITPTATNNMSQLQIQDEVVGTGAEATVGKLITVNYLGTLLDGTKFDSSYDRGTPFQFTLGAGEVIQGWDQGFAGMKVGGKRKLTIPPELGYGASAMGSIPANSTLVFEVELLKVE